MEPCIHQAEKEIATHSSVLAWRIPGTAEPGGLPSMGLQSRTRLKRLSSSSSSVHQDPGLETLLEMVAALFLQHLLRAGSISSDSPAISPSRYLYLHLQGSEALGGGANCKLEVREPG